MMKHKLSENGVCSVIQQNLKQVKIPLKIIVVTRVFFFQNAFEI